MDESVRKNFAKFESKYTVYNYWERVISIPQSQRVEYPHVL